jgi:hypothetical protein
MSANGNFMKAIIVAIFAITLLLSCSDRGSNPENRPPVITSGAVATAIVDEQFSYTATASDPDGTTPSIHFENIPGWLDTSGAVISGTATADTPDTSFTVIASDVLLTDTLMVTVNIMTGVVLISFTSEIQPIFNNNCAGSSCHIGGNANGLRLNSYSLLIQGGNSGPVVIPGDADASIIIGRLEGTITPQMPFGMEPLPEAEIQKIRDWINQGALNN